MQHNEAKRNSSTIYDIEWWKVLSIETRTHAVMQFVSITQKGSGHHKHLGTYIYFNMVISLTSLFKFLWSIFHQLPNM